MKKLLFIFGTRPEAIKMLPIIVHAKTSYKESFEVKLCVTAQHRRMLDQVLEVFEVTPDFDLDIMSKEQDLYDITSRVLLGLRGVLAKYTPDCILVHGDTTTTFAATLAAFYKKIPVAHVEAGLRTKNIYSPWPEEINRTLTGHIAKFHFAPTNVSKENLEKEGIKDNVIVTGNSVIDALLWVVNKFKADQRLNAQFIQMFEEHNVDFTKKIILVTGHRRENFGEGFINICNAIKAIAKRHNNVQIIYPVHLNPNVQTPVNEILRGVNNIILLEPLDYLPFVYLMQNCYIILTDSGGVQEEAPSLKKPVLVMRNTTERPEAIASGNVILVGTDSEMIIKHVNELLDDKDSYSAMTNGQNPYGDGYTSKLILEYLSNKL